MLGGAGVSVQKTVLPEQQEELGLSPPSVEAAADHIELTDDRLAELICFWEFCLWSRMFLSCKSVSFRTFLRCISCFVSVVMGLVI